MSSSSSNTKMFGNWMQKAEEFKKRAKKVDCDEGQNRRTKTRLDVSIGEVGK